MKSDQAGGLNSVVATIFSKECIWPLSGLSGVELPSSIKHPDGGQLLLYVGPFLQQLKWTSPVQGDHDGVTCHFYVCLSVRHAACLYGINL